MQHVLNWLRTLGVLVEHHDDWFAGLKLEACIGVILSGTGLVVNDRHGDVAQVHVRHVDVRHLMCGQLGCDCLDKC